MSLNNIELKIKNILIEKNMSAKELVAKIGMTENGFAYSIKNDTIKLKTIQDIANVLGVPVSYFFEEKEIKNGAKDGDTNYQVKKIYDIDNIELQHEVEKLRIEIESLKKEIQLKDKIIGMLEKK